MQQVSAKTGIEKNKYEDMEAGHGIVSSTDAGLLGALFNIKHEYIGKHNMQLQLLYVANDMMQMDKKKMHRLQKL